MMTLVDKNSLDRSESQRNAEWAQLDARIRGWWDGDQKSASEKDVRADKEGTLLFLPFPFVSAGGSEGSFPEMYGWDTYFINLALLAHDRPDIVVGNLNNQLFMIWRHGMVLNGNRSYFLTRSQPPLLPESLRRYYEHTCDVEILERAVPLLRREYREYWLAEHHQTPIGLAKNFDLGSPHEHPALAAECETGFDYCACFDGDVRNYAPISTNAILVQYAQNLAFFCSVLGRDEEASWWRAEAEVRLERIQTYCWSQEDGMFLDYDFVRGRRSSVWSLASYWMLEFDLCRPDQADSLAANVSRFMKPGGLSFTAEDYPNPHASLPALQWHYPIGWPPMQSLVAAALARGGYYEASREVAAVFLDLMLDQYEITGKLWEKYNVLTRDVQVPNERYPSLPMHGWASAAVVILGRILFPGEGTGRLGGAKNSLS